MKLAGIISEYNPFHNGHIYHLEQTRKCGATHIVCAMSGNFVQRGDCACADKFVRAKAAVLSGADLVVEIPTPWACSGAEHFAKGASLFSLHLGLIFSLSDVKLMTYLCLKKQPLPLIRHQFLSRCVLSFLWVIHIRPRFKKALKRNSEKRQLKFCPRPITLLPLNTSVKEKNSQLSLTFWPSKGKVQVIMIAFLC